MDFGLAKLAGSSMLTQKGTTMGTPAYMSPEQTQGEQIDHRTDIWSLGVVLYEMITAQLPFKADYEQALIYSILNEQPEPITALRSRVPMELEKIVLKCLAKDPNFRYQHANELPVDLKAVDITSSSSSVIKPTATLSTITPKRSLAKTIFAAGLWLVAIALIAVSVWNLVLSQPSKPLRRLTINTEEALSFFDGSALAVSPNGENVVYVGQEDNVTMLYLRPINSFKATPIEGSQRASSPFFSADGKWLGFYADGTLKKVSIFGGVPEPLIELSSFLGACWSRKDIIYLASKKSEAEQDVIIFNISANGGELAPVTQIKDTVNKVWHCYPELLPNEKTLLFTRLPANSRNPNEGRIEAVNLETGAQKIVLKGGIFGRYCLTGHIVATWSGGLLAAPFNVKKVEVTGPTVPILTGMYTHKGCIPNHTFSNEGTLIYLQTGAEQQNRRLVSFSTTAAIEYIGKHTKDFYNPSYSPQGNKIAVQIGEEHNSQIWFLDRDNDSLTQLTFNESNSYPIWSADGSFITYSTFKNNKWQIGWQSILNHSLNGKYTSSQNKLQPCSWSADGKILAYIEIHPESKQDIWLMKIDKDTTFTAFLKAEYNEKQAMISPDGDWIAYVSDKTGNDEIYLKSFADEKTEIKISNNGGSLPA
ncbi:MAG: protein kinase, partial [bacterium]|nr:protein kinase [bacterium]